MPDITLRLIGRCSQEQQMAVREVRNQPGVREYMYTDHEISEDEHRNWLNRLETDARQVVFVVLHEGDVAGVVSLNALDRLHKKSDWAFYLDENTRGGLGAALEFAFLEFSFGPVKLAKLNCEVIETNEAVVKLHERFGFINEGVRRSNIEKNGQRIGVVFLGITREEWLAKRDQVFEKHEKLISKFPISIEYENA